MKLKPIKTNMTELTVNDKDGEATILFSYETPVAFKQGRNFYRTQKHHSKTTTRHINTWLRLNDYEGDAILVSQTWINQLCS